ncbi:MAG: exo-beta-N-acetylmuramidase NamZ family protein, partial [Myxococcales bacterium]
MLGISELLQAVKGLKLGAILNPTSVTRDLRHLADVLHERKALAALFGPEHGVRGDVQYLEEVGEGRDARTGVPEHSLYGKDFASLTPRDEHLRGLDALLFDVQDVGSRYYTYLATMGLAMRAAAKHKLRFFVLDRPNPIGGQAVEGGVVHPGFESFVGLFPVCARHGLTAGEYARFVNEALGCDLQVIPMRGWRRDLWFRETGLPWVIPSPNMPTEDTALVYPGMCLLEGTNLSEGRGT